MDVVSTINSAIDPTYASNKACKRICLRLRTRNQRVQYVALQLLENCVRSCGEPFQAELAKSDLLNELARMGDRSVWCASEIQRLVLALIQEWAYEIKIPQFSALYNKLKQRGMPFEPRGSAIEARLQPYPGLSPPPPGGYQNYPTSAAAAGAGETHQHGHAPAHHHPQQPYPGGGGQVPPQAGGFGRPPSRSAAILGPDLLRPDRTIPELQSDLEVARGTVALLTEVLDGAVAESNWAAMKEEYCTEVASACEAVQGRVAALLGGGVRDERVVAAALEVNDEAQKALERRSHLVDVAEGRAVPPPPRARREDRDEDVPVETPVGVVNDAPQPQRQDPGPLLDLLDLDWTPAPESSTVGGGSAVKVVDPFLPPGPMEPPQMNNPFNPFAQTTAAATAAATTASAPPPKTVSSASAPPSMAVSVPVSSTPSPPEESGGGGGGQSNPFLSDDAFVGLAADPTASSGNPFASAAAGSVAGTASFKRPPPVVIPGNTNEAIPPAPYTAPPGAFQLGSGTNVPGFTSFPQQIPATTTGAGTAGAFNAWPPPARHGGGGPTTASTPMYPPVYAPTPTQTPMTSPYPGFPGHSSSVFAVPPKPQADAFTGLVALAPEKAEAPPPPK